jgi:hypothetical protein
MFRFLASLWHGGQWSPLYAFSSTGTVVEGLSGEIRSCLRSAERMLAGNNVAEIDSDDIDRLKEFLEWAEAEEAKKFPETE